MARKKMVQLIPSSKGLPKGIVDLNVRFIPRNSPAKETPAPKVMEILPSTLPKPAAYFAEEGIASHSAKNDLVFDSPRVSNFDEIQLEFIEMPTACSEILNSFKETELLSLSTPSEDNPEADVDTSSIDIPEDLHHLVTPKLVAKKAEDGGSKSVLTLEDFPPLRLSQKVIELIKAGRALHATSPFIREVGQQLLELKWHPSPKDYVTYVTYLLNAYPELQSSDISQQNCEIADQIKKMLTAFARNYRHRFTKYVPDDKRQRGSAVKSPGAEAGCSSSDVMAPAKKPRPEFSEPIGPLERLKMKHITCKEACALLLECKDERRTHIEACNKIFDVIKIFPSFVEFDVEEVALNFNTTLEQLEKLYELTATLESEKLNLLSLLDKELEVKVSKKHPSAFTIIELGDGENVQKPHKIKADGFVSISYIRSDGTITDSFLLAEGKIVSSIRTPTALQIYEMLCGSYYSFNRSYPAISKNTYDFLDLKILKTKNKNQGKKYMSFLKKIDST
ncbi:Hypothetical predicted protein [Cloeon dipterum]|uniref:Uncharacterized protein n=1 Tax=Cloeon dipterum TaxID=197152 RepID=A0A8S1DM12_9INSE|nr:Hypothetical predicted protein [Cloeon dipterum]